MGLFLVGIIHTLHDLEEIPCALFGLIDELRQYAGRRHVVTTHTHLVRGTLHLRQSFVILHQSLCHLACWYVVAVVILDRLQLVDMANTANGCTPNSAYT